MERGLILQFDFGEGVRCLKIADTALVSVKIIRTEKGSFLPALEQGFGVGHCVFVT